MLGPSGLGVLRPSALGPLEVVVPSALAALGVFVGLGVGALPRGGRMGLATAALVEAAVTILFAGAVLFWLVTRWGVPLPMPAWLFCAAAGICASASAATRAPAHNGSTASRLSRIADLDDVPLVVLGAVIMATAADRPIVVSLLLAAGASALAGAAGWLLFEYARTDAERGVFVLGAVLLLGGVGAYTGTSPLLCGCLAALLWVRAPGAADRIIAADMQKLQHPLVALLLVIAGASIEWTLALAWVAAPLVLLRLIGKLIASAAITRLTALPFGHTATVLVPPGVLGVALALNIQQVHGGPSALLLSAVTVATGISELLPVMLLGHEDDPE